MSPLHSGFQWFVKSNKKQWRRCLFFKHFFEIIRILWTTNLSMTDQLNTKQKLLPPHNLAKSCYVEGGNMLRF